MRRAAVRELEIIEAALNGKENEIPDDTRPSPEPESPATGSKRKSSDGGAAARKAHGTRHFTLPGPPPSADAMRNKINTFIESGEMKIGEFCDALGVSGNSYRRFLAQHGKEKGIESDTYSGASAFFEARKARGEKMPMKKRKTNAEGDKADKLADISDVHIDGEERDGVQVFGCCDEVRRKIAAHMRTSNVTEAQFCRDLAAQYHQEEKRIQSAQLDRFRGYKGASTGNTSTVFYAISSLTEDACSVWCRPNERPHEDKYGQLSFS